MTDDEGKISLYTIDRVTMEAFNYDPMGKDKDCANVVDEKHFAGYYQVNTEFDLENRFFHDQLNVTLDDFDDDEKFNIKDSKTVFGNMCINGLNGHGKVTNEEKYSLQMIEKKKYVEYVDKIHEKYKDFDVMQLLQAMEILVKENNETADEQELNGNDISSEHPGYMVFENVDKVAIEIALVNDMFQPMMASYDATLSEEESREFKAFLESDFPNIYGNGKGM